ncbi:MAG: hypothetical protein JWQ96_3365 [Segetibacter sp.]|nr:hypothetical protein [Segetibacter sp.]
MKLLSAVAAGVAGAVGLTLMHETLKRVNKDAPRMDILGMNALAMLLTKADQTIPNGKQLFNLTIAGDIASNGLYYSLVGAGSDKLVWMRGTFLGLVAGLGAVYLPFKLGLEDAPSTRTPQTKVMTVALYLSGGLIAAAASNAFNNSSNDKYEYNFDIF